MDLKICPADPTPEMSKPGAPPDNEMTEGMLRDDISRLQDIIGDIRILVAELYADRGEDARTYAICNEVLALCKRA